MTDIGLSVREANGTVYVWATSLTRGVPVAGLRVLVYGANNVVLGEGLTDADGWCCCEMPKGETKPFAVVAAQMDDSDVSFLALRGDLDETATLGARRAFVKENGSEAYVWTERGIYRHNEPIFVHAILRDGRATRRSRSPSPSPSSLPTGSACNAARRSRTGSASSRAQTSPCRTTSRAGAGKSAPRRPATTASCSVRVRSASRSSCRRRSA